jgi:hypothetical protein
VWRRAVCLAWAVTRRDKKQETVYAVSCFFVGARGATAFFLGIFVTCRVFFGCSGYAE